MNGEPDEAWTAHAYGKSENCFIDYRQIPYCYEYCIESLGNTFYSTDAQGLVPEAGVQQASLPSPTVDLEERIETDDVDVESHKNVDSLLSGDSTGSLLFKSPLSILKSLRLPLEIPQLASDPAKDLKRYLQVVACKRSSDIFNQWLPLSSTDENNDDSIAFLKGSDRLHALLERELHTERIDVSSESLRLQKEMLDMPECASMELFPSISSKTDIDLQPITPPLSPVSTGFEPFVPGGDVCFIDLTSEPESPVDERFDTLYGNLESDPVLPSIRSTSSLSPPVPLVVAQTSRCHKIDVPLVLIDSSPRPVAPEREIPDLPSIEEIIFNNGDQISNEHHEFENFFDDALSATLDASRTQVDLMVQQEDFNPVHSTSRLRVPSMDFTIPCMEWIAAGPTAKRQFAWLKDTHQAAFSSCPPTPCSSSLNNSLRWSPILQGQGQVSTNEQIEALSSLAKKLLLVDTVDYHASANFLPNLNTELMIIRTSKDEEIEEMTDQKALSLSHPKLACNQMNNTTSSSIQLPMPGASIFFSSTKEQLQNPWPSPSTIKAPSKQHFCPYFQPSVSGSSQTMESPSTMAGPDLLDLVNLAKARQGKGSTQYHSRNSDSYNTTFNLLSNFMEMRCAKRPRLIESNTTPGHEISIHNTKMKPVECTRHEEQKALVPAPAPSFNVPQTPGRFIISLHLSRSILRHVESHWPPEDLIDRDHSAYNKNSEESTSLSSEADISLTPTIGIVITSLVQIKQRPLPGSKSLPRIRERVATVAQKYESLFVLVSESNPAGDVPGQVSSSDMAAYADFVKFSIALQAGVAVYFIPGADATMAKWISALLCRFTPNACAIKRFLSGRENTWERFFRRAGMNVTASQVLAGNLLEEAGGMGLARFIGMTEEERIQRYGRLLGGKKALLGMSRIVDQVWD